MKSLAMTLMLFSGPALAVIDLLPKTIEVLAQPAQVTIVNKSDHQEFVAVTLSRLKNPGDPYEQEQLEPVGLSRHPLMYAFPFQLSLARGQSKTITLKPLSAVDKETVYRLVVKPVTALSSKNPQRIAAGIAVNLSFSALVRQLPEKQTRTMASRCTPEGVTLIATGTTRYRVEGLSIGGHLQPAFNVYPGTPQMVAGGEIKIDAKLLCH